jgi:hypothetical protein
LSIVGAGLENLPGAAGCRGGYGEKSKFPGKSLKRDTMAAEDGKIELRYESGLGKSECLTMKAITPDDEEAATQG